MNSMGPRPSGFSSGSMTHEDTAQAFHPSRAGASSPYQLMPGMHPQQQQHLQQDPGFQMRQGMHPQHHQHLHRDVPYQIKHEPGRQRLLPQQPMHHHQHLQQQQQPQQHSQQQQHPMFLHQQQQQPQMHQQYGGFQPQMQGMPQQQHHRHMNMSAQIGQHMDTYPPLPTQNSAGNARAPGIDIHITQVTIWSKLMSGSSSSLYQLIRMLPCTCVACCDAQHAAFEHAGQATANSLACESTFNGNEMYAGINLAHMSEALQISVAWILRMLLLACRGS